MFRILRPGRTLVSFDGFRMRDPVNAQEQAWAQDVLDGWTISLPPTPQEFQGAALAAGFQVLRAEDATSHVYASARRIAQIAAAVLLPLTVVARIPLLGGLVKPLGLPSPRHSRRFVDACRSQLKLFDAGLGAYYVHVLRKPG